MTQTIHDFVEWKKPIRNSPKWSCSGRPWQFKSFLLEMLSSMVEIFHPTFSNHLGGFS
jgi:hypothetical protein